MGSSVSALQALSGFRSIVIPASLRNGSSSLGCCTYLGAPSDAFVAVLKLKTQVCLPVVPPSLSCIVLHGFEGSVLERSLGVHLCSTYGSSVGLWLLWVYGLDVRVTRRIALAGSADCPLLGLVFGWSDGSHSQGTPTASSWTWIGQWWPRWAGYSERKQSGNRE